MRVFIIGDIHGMYSKLLPLMNRLINEYNLSKEDYLVFVGDYIDRGEESFEVVDFLIKLKEKYNVSFIKGNHEDMLLSCVREDYRTYINPCDDFYNNGGYTTIESYFNFGYNILNWEIPEEHKIFFQSLKPFIEIDNLFITHAGVLPNNDLNNQNYEDLLWIRNEFINSQKDFGKLVIAGHTIVGHKPIICKNKVLIDTGAYLLNGNLSCILYPSLKIIQ